MITSQTVTFEMQLADGLELAFAAELESRARAIAMAAQRGEALDDPLEIGLRLTSDAEIRELNATYRGRDEPTDVLAFALREAPGGEATPSVLGDVVVSVETAERQRGSRPLDVELDILFAHGLCHLLGYDHQDDLEEAEMNARVDELLEAAGSAGTSRRE